MPVDATLQKILDAGKAMGLKPVEQQTPEEARMERAAFMARFVPMAEYAGVRAADGIVLLSSRVSVEMVQKAAVLGAPLIVAVSAPTALAVRVAEAAGMTLIGIARADGFEVFTHPNRITSGLVRHVA